MNHPDFLAWMLLFPIASAISSYLRPMSPMETDPRDGAKAIAALIILAIWGGVGWLLY